MATFFQTLETSEIHMVSCSEAQIDNLIGGHALWVPSDCVLRIIRGQRCQTTAALFQEFAAALQFPHYFGHNWDAFDECLGDLAWLPARTYVLVITNADRLLATSQRDLKSFCGALAEAISELAHSTGIDAHVRPEARLYLVLQVEEKHLSQAIRRLSTAGLEITRSDGLLESQHEETKEC